MISLIILIVAVILALVGLIVFNNVTENVTYDLRLFKLGLFLYFVALIFDFIKELSAAFPYFTTSLEVISLKPEYLVLASKLVLIPLCALVLAIGLVKLNQEMNEDFFRTKIEKM